MNTLTVNDLTLDIKVKLDVKGSEPYVMDAVVWRVQDDILTFKDSRKHLFVYFSPEAILNGTLIITRRK